jgi:hypothetical protein
MLFIGVYYRIDGGICPKSCAFEVLSENFHFGCLLILIIIILDKL